MEDKTTFCAGTGPDGNPCICRRCVPKTNKDPDDPDICKNCSHMESAHPTTAAARMDITSYVKDLRNAGKVKAGPSSSSQLKTSLSDAEAETSSGLRPNTKKRKSTGASKTDSEPELKKSKGVRVFPDVIQ